MLEACVDSVESALAAAEGGAKRLELCADLPIGGTTPGINLYQAVKSRVQIPIRVLIRPRFGDFIYTEYELEVMKADIEMFKKHGAEGIVFGVLRPDATLDTERIKELKEAAGQMGVTLHRAFDMTADPLRAMEEAIALGMDAILTSGQKNRAVEGAQLIQKLVEASAGRIEILVGGGISADAIFRLYPLTKASAYHMTGKEIIKSPMEVLSPDVTMGLPGLGEYEIWRTRKETIEEACMLLHAL